MLRVIFLIAVVLGTAFTLYLSRRQSRYVGSRSCAVPADFAASCTLEDHRKAAAYARARERLARWEAVAEALLAAAWALGGVDLLYQGVAAALPPTITRGVVFLIATGAVSALVSLPFDALRVFGVERRFGFNRTSVAQFAADRLKGGVISLAVLAPILYALLFAMRSLTGLWWVWAWLGLVALMLAAPAFYVRVVAPRFNRFEPLQPGPLRERIETVLARSGFRSSGLFTMDASRRSAHGNAYFVGFGRTKRIVLFDTLVERCPPEEIEAIVAHELGHFRRHHVVFGVLRSAAILFIALAAFGWLTKQPWLSPSFGIIHRDDALALFVCVLLASAFAPLLAPISNWISRRNEFQADDYARRMVGADAISSALVRLARDNASSLTPDPLYSLVHHSHPPIAQRVRAIRAQALAAATE